MTGTDDRRAAARRSARLLGIVVVAIYLGYIAWHLIRLSA